LRYPISVNEQAEVDALVIFDRYIFVLEGKGGSRNRTYNETGTKARLDELVGEPTKQALRAQAYLRANPTAVLTRADGSTLEVTDTSTSEIVPISISLDSLDVYTSELKELQNILALTELAWAVCLTDLRVISEIVSRPSEFTHYLRWRMSVGQRTDVLGDRDEINWLAVYLRDGPMIPQAAEGDDFLILNSYTDAFDAYFLHMQGNRTRAEKRPRQEIPDGVGQLLDALEASRLKGFTQAAEFILDFQFEQRRELDNTLRRHGAAAADHPEPVVTLFEYGNKGIVFRSNPKGQQLAAPDLTARSCSRRTLVLTVSQGPTWNVIDWEITSPTHQD
jgi:hypothetical protein